MRVTSEKLKKMVDEINLVAGLGNPWGHVDGVWQSMPGAYILEHNISGYQLQMICNFDGAVREQSSYTSAREMYHRLRGMYEALHLDAEVNACKLRAEEGIEVR